MNEYLFTFTEITYGSVKIKANQQPDEDDVIGAINKGDAYYNKSEHEDIKLSECTPCEEGT